MTDRIKILDIELSHPLKDITNLDDYFALQGLVRLHGTPLGYVKLPIVNGCCTANAVSKAIVDQCSWDIIQERLDNWLADKPLPDQLQISDLLKASPPGAIEPFPLVSVAVCTRNRADSLALCLNALMDLDYPNLEILVIDNSPSDDAIKNLVTTQYPSVRYVCEPRPGLDWARNRAIIEAQGEIIAYTDDDVIVDPKWATAIAEVFVESADVMAVTGLVVPYELETRAQRLFETYGGFGRGFEKKWFRLGSSNQSRWTYFGTGQYGTGANMAYRRTLFDQIGYFDPALDVGTVTNGGGDLEMFFRVLKEGYTLVYEPKAIIRHCHRRDYAKLKTQITNNGIGLASYFVRSMLVYPDEKMAFFRLGIWWLWWWYIRRLLLSFLFPFPIPRELIWTEIQGYFAGFSRYQKSRRNTAEITNTYGPQIEAITPVKRLSVKKMAKHPHAMAVRRIDVSQPLVDLDVSGYSSVRIFATCRQHLLGSFDLAILNQVIPASRLRHAIVKQFRQKLLNTNQNYSDEEARLHAINLIKKLYLQTKSEKQILAKPRLPSNIPVSIVVATFDRPDDLRNCLKHLVAQNTLRNVEIVIVDNNPSSGLTAPVVAEFKDVVLVNERRKGLSYARNAGIGVSTGEIIIATDDDVTVPPDWLENLIAPFARPDVMVVTGNVLPLELENTAQHLFERYGGLGRGFKAFEVNRLWFESFGRFAVPTWELGATANAAFRASIFYHPDIGLMEERLGAGMPTGVAEDTYVFYKVLRAGYTLVYEPDAYVWHKHRTTISKLRHQLFSYSKGHVAYHLITLFQDHDLRGLCRLVLELPKWRLIQLFTYLKDILNGNLFRGQASYPLSLILLETWGNLLGPWALWQSHQRVKHEGRSQRYIPVAERLTQLSTASLDDKNWNGLSVDGRIVLNKEANDHVLHLES